jgi:hypothetical protein
MPDDAPNPPSSEPTPDAFPPGDLDETLANLSTLAGDLAEQVGVSERPPGQAVDVVASAEGGGPAVGDAIDAQLAALEQRLVETQTTISDVPSTEAAAETTGTPAPEVTASAAESVPAESNVTVRSVEQSSPAPAAGGKVIQLGKRKTPAPAAAPQPEAAPSSGYDISMEDFADGDSGGSGSSLDEPTEAAAPAPSPPADFAAAAAEAVAQAQPMPGPVVRLAVTTLEAIDLPFRWLSDKPRRIIGWLALATLFAALCIFVTSIIL